MKKTYLGIWAAMAFLCTISTYAQKDYSSLIKDYLQKEQSNLRLDAQDYSDLKIYNQYHTESMDMVHVYTIQKINNIPVFNAIGNFAIKNDEIVYFGNRFKTNLKKGSNASSPSLTPNQAVHRAAKQLGLTIKEPLKILSTENPQEFLFSKAGISQTEIPVKLVYQPMEDESLRLAWDLSIHTITGLNWWSVRVDALNGEIIDKNNWAIFCAFPRPGSISANTKNKEKILTFGKAPLSILGDDSQYEVFALPIESPNHGNRSIVSEPANVTASPFGWHDFDGALGADFTTTQGNNVMAVENRDENSSNGILPDGGATLNFSFPLSLNQDPSGYIPAAVVNLFYMNNMMHDIWHHYGFTEASGNFQNTNYTSNGLGNDYVTALAQYGAVDGPGNNAVFMPTPEGQSPIMAMFTWQPVSPPQYLTINTAGSLSGSYTAATASFGLPLSSTTPITADMVLIEDDNSGISTDTYDGCDDITNAAQISGKIAVIRRGECSFTSKVLKAENEGALAVIVVNDVAGNPTTMGGTNTSITIPSIMLSMADSTPIMNALINGDTINASLMQYGPFQRDGDLDNGVIAHEYGHGISSRLTGGPTQADCLQNEEQMGEGWSDFFALVLTMQPNDLATGVRGMATYALNQPTTGTGLRQHPYTTDMTINPFTYGDVQSQFNMRGSHGVGSVWATMLWDMTWALIDQYGFDPDLYNGTGGNNIAMQLVIDGLKLQPCGPGFVDGRDAILAADLANNNGANQCLLWGVFANRGLGYNANQGSSFSATDQTEAFDMPPTSVLNCTAGTSDFDESYLQLYPNPTHGTVNIVSTKIHGEVQISLFDINGRKVMTQKVDMDGKARIDVSHLSIGIYVVQFVSNEKTQTEKLIID